LAASLCHTPSRFCVFLLQSPSSPRCFHSFPTRRSSDLLVAIRYSQAPAASGARRSPTRGSARRNVCCATSSASSRRPSARYARRSEEHTSELQSLTNIVCRLLLEQKATCQHLRPLLHHT